MGWIFEKVTRMAYLNINGTTMYCEVHGHGTPIVFVHDAMVDHRMWHAQVSAFSGRNRVIVYDLRGHGKTGPTQQSSYTVPLMTEDLLGLIDALNLHRPVLCGCSFGGMIVQQFALTHPEMISGLILCDSTLPMTLTLPDKVQASFFNWSMTPSVRLLGAQRFTDYAFWLARLMASEDEFGHDPQTRDYIRQCMRSIPTEEMIKIYRMILHFQPVDPREIGVPILRIDGHQEPKNDNQQTPLLKQQVSSARFEMLPTTGNSVNLKNPERFNAILEKFLSVLQDAAFLWKPAIPAQPGVPIRSN